MAGVPQTKDPDLKKANGEGGMKVFFEEAMACLLLIPILSLPVSAKNPTWLKDSMEVISGVGANPTDEQIKRLGNFARIGTDTGLDAEQIEVSKSAQAKLLSIPHISEYFGDKIRKITDSEMALRKDSLERWWQYETLQQLPTPETVKVLGELLFDEKGKQTSNDPLNDSSLPEDNCRYSARSLAVLIDKPPYDSKLYPSSDSALDAWRLWYQQVKAGTRTFCFKGSTVAYTLSGPATDKPEAHPNPRSQPGAASKATSTPHDNAPADAPEKSPWPKIATSIAALFALLGGWLAFRKRKIPA